MPTPRMTQAHYKYIAHIIATIADIDEDTREKIAVHFETELIPTNPLFDRHRFFNAAMGAAITRYDL